MCNIGTAMNSLSRDEEAREWWWKALVLQPMYWDVMVCHFYQSVGCLLEN